MRYLKCLVTKNGLFNGKTLGFEEGINVVIGRNGSGKSLLARCLVECLWRRETAPSLLRGEGWDSLHCEIDFILSSQYRVTNSGEKYYKLVESKNGGEAALYSEYTRGDEGDEAGKDPVSAGLPEGELKNFLKAERKNAFCDAVFMPAPFDMNGPKHFDYQDLRGIMLEDGSRFYLLYQNLRSIFTEDMKVDDTLLDTIVEHRKTLKDIERELQIGGIRDGRKKKLVKEKKTIQEEITSLAAAIASLEEQRELLVTIRKNLRTIEELRKGFEQMKDEVSREQEKIKTARTMRKEIDSRYPQFNAIQAPDEDLDALQGTFNELRKINQRLNDLRASTEKKRRRIKWLLAGLDLPVAIVLGLFLARSLINPAQSFMVPAFIAGAMLPVNLALAIAYLTAGREKELAMLEEEHQALTDRFRSMLRERSLKMEDCRVTEIYSYLLQYFEDYIDYSERKKHLTSLEASLKDREYLAEIKSRIEAMKKEEKELAEDLDSRFRSVSVAEGIDRETGRIEELIQTVESEIQINRDEIAAKENVLAQVDREIINETTDDGRRDILIQERSAHSDAIQKWNTNQESLVFIMETLAAAVERREENGLRKLASLSVDYFNGLTGGQYASAADEKDLAACLREGALPPDLPAPAAHSMLLAVKIALSDHLNRGLSPFPLIIDEPFLNMDEERSGRLRDLLTQIAAHRQVILFTHHREKGAWGNALEL